MFPAGQLDPNRVQILAAGEPVPVVAMEREGQVSGVLIEVLIGASVCPFAECGLYEPLGLAVGFRGVGPASDMSELELFAGSGEGCRSVAGVAVGHHPLDDDAEVVVAGHGGREEGCDAFFFCPA